MDETYVNNVGSKDVNISVYPNPVFINESFTVKVSGLAKSELTGALIKVYNIKGMPVYITSNVGYHNELRLEKALDRIYFVHLITTSGKVITNKIILKKE